MRSSNGNQITKPSSGVIEEGVGWFCWRQVCHRRGGSIGLDGMGLALLSTGLIYLYVVDPDPAIPGSTSKGTTKLPNYVVTVVAPTPEPALPLPAFLAGDGWLFPHRAPTS